MQTAPRNRVLSLLGLGFLDQEQLMRKFILLVQYLGDILRWQIRVNRQVYKNYRAGLPSFLELFLMARFIKRVRHPLLLVWP